MATSPESVEALEEQAARQRERMSRRVAELRFGLRQPIEVRRIAEESIKRRPGAIYCISAALAALTGYIFARFLK
jgi:hypothetical protein